TQQYYNSLTNRSEFNDLMKNHGIYYDFNETLQLNDSLCFYDMSHLNQNGVDIFDKEFIDVILMNKPLKPTSP
ncbi:hypothetical protein EZS27_033380, partial [termite gut metagenome]